MPLLQVHYQPGQADQLYHRYEYDADNRITDVYVTDNKKLIGDRDLEEHDARYGYYKHGPLARTVIGHQQVQGMDYAYTLQGWLKGVNSTGLDANLDMGGDGKAGSINKVVARDEYGFSLNYFTGDYSAISNKNIFPGHSAFMPAGQNRELYNGNISSMAVNINKLSVLPSAGGAGGGFLYNYQYDQLNRIVAMDAYRGFNTTNNNWNAIAVTQDYRERISYDANGNILSYLRNGTTAGGKQQTMDNMTYQYFKNTDGTLRNNRLRMVTDAVAAANYTEDIDDQLASVSNAADSNYVYDAIGNLIKDKAEKITNIEWSVYGKILSITKDAPVNGDVKQITYSYDAAGNRIGKRVEKKGAQHPDTYTWYVRDATGNTMAVYTYEGNNVNSNTLYLTEQHLYGSSRLGIWNRNINMDAPLPQGDNVNLLGKGFAANFERGNKFFELSNHLGNVLVTVSDKKLGVSSNSTTIDYYTADVVTANDYAPFGMQMPGRKFNAANSGYRYGFNGKEQDKETTGTSTYDYGFRIYNPALGRFLSVDPLFESYPWNSPYSYAEGDPIDFNDLDGLEKPYNPAQATEIPAAPITKVITDENIRRAAQKMADEAAKNGGGLSTELQTKKRDYSWLRRIGSLGSKVLGTIAAVFTPVPDAGCNGCFPANRAPLNVPFPESQPKTDQPDPRTIAPPPKDGEDGASLYKTLDYNKSTLGNRNNDADNKRYEGYVATKNPIPYIGITVNKLIGERYAALSTRGANSEIILQDKYTTIAGAETAVIALNTYGTDYKMHLNNLLDEDVKYSTRISNLKFTHRNSDWIRAGIILLNTVRPGWDKPDNPNSLIQTENEKGKNHPDNK